MISAVVCVLLRLTPVLNFPCVSVLFWLISITRFVFKSASIYLKRTTYDIYCERVAYSHSISGTLRYHDGTS